MITIPEPPLPEYPAPPPPATTTYSTDAEVQLGSVAKVPVLVKV